MLDNKLNTLSARLSFALEQLGVTQAELARNIQVKRQAIQYLCSSGATKSKFAYDIAEALGISVDWLTRGDGEMRLELSQPHFAPLCHFVPVIEWNKIELWLNKQLDLSLVREQISVCRKNSESMFALKLKDNSMYPRFDSNTVIIIDPNATFKSFSYVVAYVKRLNDFIFRLLSDEGGKRELLAYNEVGYKPITLAPEDRVIGYMTEARWLML